MQKKSFRYSSASVDYYFSGSIRLLSQLTERKTTVLVTDENIYTAQARHFRNWKTIVIPAGEHNKVQSTVDNIIDQLIAFGADRSYTLAGVGGGVVTDITGYAASIYMRGISFGFVPTTLLAMVDASIGGKNGVDSGLYKNLVGTIRQPAFILFDHSLLQTLSHQEWINGFAEIIKHASIRDAAMFRELEDHDVSYYKSRKKIVEELIRRNAILKTKLVQADEYEKGDRKLLNFGHTLGHAIEKQYNLSHGAAISIGMTYAARLSRSFCGFKDVSRLVGLLEKFELPVKMDMENEKIMNILKMDKKRTGNAVNFVLLQKIGKALIHPVSLKEIYETI